MLHSLVLATDYRVADAERMWSLIVGGRSPLTAIGAHHAVFYESIHEPGRVLVTLGIRNSVSVKELLRSPALFEWFDLAGVNDVPAIFAGEVLEKIDMVPRGADRSPTGVIVGVVSSVDDVSDLMDNVHSRLDRFRTAGVRKLWVYNAFDDEREVMTLLELDSLADAQHWIDRPDAAAEWMPTAGVGVYPSPFIGKLAHIAAFDEAQ
ncbi:fatty-acid--CoA ligase [Mycobacterium sp. M1]|uniref:Fatty-acid--CoA ligase n=1 Tax=Mycolicibacter acidiphilus TaxID=2835306 RepID=A0ABS5REU6_9MYCO|nr:fatty-acid--CoA ligase [Mycolicibacter acidiphilus]